MGFELRVQSGPPLTHESNPERVARMFADQIGFAPLNANRGDLGFRILYECFLKHPRRGWTPEEIATQTDTTLTSTYRHLNRLRDLDIIEEASEHRGEKSERIMRLRYGSLRRAWSFAEAHFQEAIRSYRETVDHLSKILEHDAPSSH